MLLIPLPARSGGSNQCHSEVRSLSERTSESAFSRSLAETQEWALESTFLEFLQSDMLCSLPAGVVV
jgi:hypothetical protein